MSRLTRFGIIPAHVFDKDLEAPAIALLAAISTFADKDGWCFPKLETLGQMLNRSKGWVSGQTKVLEAAGMITTKCGAGNKMVFRILYDRVQHTELRVQPAKLSYNNTKEHKRISKPQKTLIPDDFAVSPEMMIWARKEVPNVNMESETKKFINHAEANDRKCASNRGWIAAWRNWLLNASEFSNVKAYRSSSSKPANAKPTLEEIYTAMQSAKKASL